MIRIENNTGVGIGTKIFVDGVELRGVTSLSIDPIFPSEQIKASIVVLVDELDVEIREALVASDSVTLQEASLQEVYDEVSGD